MHHNCKCICICTIQNLVTLYVTNNYCRLYQNIFCHMITCCIIIIENVGACSDVPLDLKECNYINWDTLELDLWIPYNYIDTFNFTL